MNCRDGEQYRKTWRVTRKRLAALDGKYKLYDQHTDALFKHLVSAHVAAKENAVLRLLEEIITPASIEWLMDHREHWQTVHNLLDWTIELREERTLGGCWLTRCILWRHGKKVREIEVPDFDSPWAKLDGEYHAATDTELPNAIYMKLNGG